MSHTMAQVRAVLAATNRQGVQVQAQALLDYWVAGREPREPKDATMTNDRWNGAVNSWSLNAASVAFMIDREVGAVFMALLRADVAAEQTPPTCGPASQSVFAELPRTGGWRDGQRTG